MKTRHLTEKEIQEYAINPDKRDPIISEHLHSCESCKIKAANYETLFSSIRQQAKPAFEFDLAGLVLTQIEVKRPVASRPPVVDYLIGTIALTLLAAPFYIYRDLLSKIFEGTSVVVLYLIITTAITIIIFQIFMLYHKYQRQMNALDHIGNLQH
jgi:hypothetical protein